MKRCAPSNHKHSFYLLTVKSERNSPLKMQKMDLQNSWWVSDAPIAPLNRFWTNSHFHFHIPVSSFMEATLQRSPISLGILTNLGWSAPFLRITSCKSGKWWINWRKVTFSNVISPITIYYTLSFVILGRKHLQRRGTRHACLRAGEPGFLMPLDHTFPDFFMLFSSQMVVFFVLFSNRLH